MKKNISLLEGIHESAQIFLNTEKHHVFYHKESFEGESLISKIKNSQGLGIRSKTQLTKAVIKKLDHLEAIGAFCIGTNQIDLDAASEKGIPVFNAPYSNTRSVAELVLCEVIALSRKLTQVSSDLHKGVWNKSASGSFEVRGKTIGIIGYGHIGTQVGILAEGLGLKVIYYDVQTKLPLGNALPVKSLKKLLELSDFVTLHVPETEKTKNMLAKDEIKNMKRGSYLINASRGSVVDLKELAKAIKSQHLAGAAIDVYPKEPCKNGPGFNSEIKGLSNIILTPHIGGSTEEAQKNIGEEVSLSLNNFFKYGDTSLAVNFPKIAVDKIKKGCIRLTHTHKNIPGVLGKVNSLFSEAGLNVSYQSLATKDELGYLIVDFDKAKVNQNDLLKKLNEESFTIKTKILN